MTIHGIWSLLGSLLERKVCYYEALAGRRVGIDASKWLHAFCSSKKNVMACVMRNDFTLVLKAFRARLEKFKIESVVPVFVFDGMRPLAKSAVDASRAASRADHLQKARQYLTSGDQVSALAEAQQAVTIPDVLVFLIVHEVLRPMGFAHVRAPGEADGQLASMLLHGIVDAVDSDDGDLMAHGVRELYSKVNYETGACTRYLADDWERSSPVAELDAKFEADVKHALQASESKAKKSRDLPALLLKEAPIRAELDAKNLYARPEQSAKPVTISLLKALVATDTKFKFKGTLKRDELVDHVLAVLSDTVADRVTPESKPKPIAKTNVHFAPLATLVCPSILVSVLFVPPPVPVPLLTCSPLLESRVESPTVVCLLVGEASRPCGAQIPCDSLWLRLLQRFRPGSRQGGQNPHRDGGQWLARQQHCLTFSRLLASACRCNPLSCSRRQARC